MADRAARLLALADDATGALETGAQFAAQGIDSTVVLRGHAGWFDLAAAVVVDTETRHAPADEARRIARAWTAEARARGVRFLYKKTDSTLRGNIAAECAGMLEGYPGASLVYAPAYPRLGRRVRAGRVYLGDLPLSETEFARDRRSPVREDRVPELLAAAGCEARSAGPSELKEHLPPPGPVLICDSETDRDLEAIAEALDSWMQPPIAAGPGGFAGVWARRLRMPRTFAPRALPGLPCLAVAGSLHPASLAQARRAGCVPHELANAAPAAIAAEIQASGFAVLTTSEEVSGAVSGRLAAATRAVLGAVAVRTLVIFGGDTAVAILDELGVGCLKPLGELRDGVPASLIQAAGRETGLITKAGGFGDADTLAAIRRTLEQQA
jgi:uncharacterized protein YgbK (DUF1537 family)